VVLGFSREMGIIASFRTRPAAPLTSGPARRRPREVRRVPRRLGRGGGLGLSTEELLLAHAKPSLKPVDLGLELGLAFEGAAMHGLPVGGLAKRLEFLLQSWANRTGALGKRRSGTDRFGRRRVRRSARGRSAQFRDRDPQGGETQHRGRTVIQDGRI
jgi:hypothetical protein